MIRRIMVLLAVVFVVVGGVAGGALAKPKLNEHDKAFLAQAHRSNLAEIQAAQLAEKKSSDQSIQAIARKLVADHTQLDSQIKQTAEKVGVKLPEKPGSKQTSGLEKLSKLNGAAFNSAWVRTQIAGHRQFLANINKELREGSSPEVKKLASDAKPVIQGHLDLLQQIHGGGKSPHTAPPHGVTPTR
ncbi:DUF4142 domain-containing protein [Streptosporangium sp. NPDC051022]|uniref:DUF4142 domain-containing protein n=1 Tax=Streptosporangium sp. NPDC051022 TaxID=3155752 RepID=UPI00341A9B06